MKIGKADLKFNYSTTVYLYRLPKYSSRYSIYPKLCVCVRVSVHVCIMEHKVNTILLIC